MSDERGGPDGWLLAGGPVTGEEVGTWFRREGSRVVSVLARAFGDLDLAEDAVQEAFAVALDRWPRDGMPPSPAGWLVTTARRKGLDRLRREAARRAKQQQVALLDPRTEPATPEDEVEEALTAIPDERLSLLFACCHPALAVESRVALTLRVLGGLTTSEIAAVFLVPETTMGQRISRAKAKIRDAGIPFRVPDESELPERLGGVLAVVYLVFTAGYAAPSGPDLTRPDLATEALRLGRILGSLLPDEPEALGLQALMLLTESRRPARTSADGDVVLLAEQDRGLWNAGMVAEGQALVRRCLAIGRPGPYQLQAAIAAVHSDTRTAADTDWAQVVALYDHLLAVSPSPVVALHRAVAVGELDGAQVALALVDAISGGDRLGRHHLLHAVRADLLGRLGREEEAVGAMDTAISLCGNAAERRLLVRAREGLVAALVHPPGER